MSGRLRCTSSRKSWYGSGPAKAGPEQISLEQSRDVTSALVVSKGKEIKIDFLSSRYGSDVLRVTIYVTVSIAPGRQRPAQS